jgi:hypothetical protein
LSLASKTGKSVLSFLQPKQKDSIKIIFLCLSGATIFWFFNSLNKEYTTRINYPVSFELNEDSVVVMRELPDRIRLDVTSGGWNILRKSLGVDNEPVSIPLNKPTETRYLTGSYLLPTISDQISELLINYVVTDTLYFQIEKKTSKRVALRLDSLRINLERNHRVVSSCVLEPDSLDVYGPKSMIDTLSSIVYVPVKEREIDRNYSRKVTVPLNNNDFLYTSPREIEVRFDVEEMLYLIQRVNVQPVNFPDSLVKSKERWRVELGFWVKESMVNQSVDSLFFVELDYFNLNVRDSTIIPRVRSFPEFIDSLELRTILVRI